MSDPQVAAKADVVLVGAGIMSATLGALLRRLEPDWSITLIERLDAAGAESSDAWNNAGTGHSGLCELFYTPQQPDGSVDVSKAVRVNEQFQVTRQFWAYAASNGIVSDVPAFCAQFRMSALCRAQTASTICAAAGRRWPVIRCLPAANGLTTQTNSPDGCH